MPDREVWAFGSRATRTAKDHSDLDLAVIGDEPLAFGVLADLHDDFSESDLPYRVDVVDWAKVSQSFRKIIRKAQAVMKKGSGKKKAAGPICES